MSTKYVINLKITFGLCDMSEKGLILLQENIMENSGPLFCEFIFLSGFVSLTYNFVHFFISFFRTHLFVESQPVANDCDICWLTQSESVATEKI